MLRIALPNKGRLADETLELLRDAGLHVRARGERALSAPLGDDFEAIFVRAQDIPEFVADGAAGVGITGWDLVCESERPLRSLLDLGFGACRLVVGASDASRIESLADVTGTPRVATPFPRLARRFFEQACCQVSIVPVSGAAEITPHLGVADMIVDLTSTGSTFHVHDLHEVATILHSSAHLIVRDGDAGRDPLADRCAVDELVAALASVLRARSQRYLMANVPRDVLARVKEVLPGLNGPTVVDVMNSGRHVAVHAVVSQQAIYRTIAQLKSLGAEGILVTRIERLMP
ncbi:MAG TPA: ATP phosphoribosyltransferase [Gemmatimonadaceae bacterium]|nr:ATP phosphoribosyltransferase [Gemmatimonadaceae bacterium]